MEPYSFDLFADLLLDDWQPVHERQEEENSDSNCLSIDCFLSFSPDTFSTGKDSNATAPESPPPSPLLLRQKKEKKSSLRQKKGIDYEKNIYAYISKVIVKFFVSQKVKADVLRLCKRVGCNYKEAVGFYKKKEKEVFGIGHLSEMLIPEAEEEVKIKKVFYLFLTRFLRQKYLVYMVKNGKMEDKEIYISYKNQFFLYIDQEIKNFY